MHALSLPLCRRSRDAGILNKCRDALHSLRYDNHSLTLTLRHMGGHPIDELTWLVPFLKQACSWSTTSTTLRSKLNTVAFENINIVAFENNVAFEIFERINFERNMRSKFQ